MQIENWNGEPSRMFGAISSTPPLKIANKFQYIAIPLHFGQFQVYGMESFSFKYL